MSEQKSVSDINWQPDRNKNIPLSKQIIKYMIDRITNGDWVVGEKLPSQRELATLFQVNRSTIVEAIAELVAMGVLEGNYGKGTWIANTTWSVLMSKTPNWQSYISSSQHDSNLPIIQTINKKEFQKDIIRLGTGELSPDLLPASRMNRILGKIAERESALNYLEPLGLLELRKSLCKYLSTHGIKVKPSNILIVSGSLQALHLISFGLMKLDSKVFTESPSYLNSLNIFQSARAVLEGVPMDRDGMIPSMINMQKRVRETTLLYTIPTFHNPTGNIMSEKRRIELLEWCKIQQLPIIEDDAYRDLWFDSPPPQPLKARDKHGTVLYLGSISKTLAPGFRLGWLVGPESIVDHLGDIKMQIDYGVSSISQWAFTEWLDSGMYQKHLKELRQKLIVRMNLTTAVLDDYFSDIAEWTVPKGSFYIWLKLKNAVSMPKLFSRALEHNILLNPGSIYDPRDTNHLRISYSYADPKDMRNGLIELAEIIRNL